MVTTCRWKGRTWNTPGVHLESGGGGGYGAPPVHLFAADDATHTPYCAMLQIEKEIEKQMKTEIQVQFKMEILMKIQIEIQIEVQIEMQIYI